MNNDHTVDKTKCAAYGCPCLGTMTSSNSGSDAWFCGFHFNRDAISWSKITLELNRLQWLVWIIRDLRPAYSAGGDWWKKAATAAMREISMNQRSDLSPGPGENGGVWINRLNAALTEAIGRAPRPDAMQAGLAGIETVVDTFKKPSFSMPKQEATA